MERLVRGLFVGLGSIAGFGTCAQAQKHFSEVDLSGIVQGTLYEMAEGFGGGVAIADFDDDGDLDFFLPKMEGMDDCLIQNSGVRYNIARMISCVVQQPAANRSR